MKKKVLSLALSAPKASGSNTAEVDLQWQRVIQRRSFLKGLGMVTAALPASGLLSLASEAQTQNRGKLSKGDAAILRLLAAAELIESDLWFQYAELGGVAASDASEEFRGFNGGNPPYVLALST